MRILMTTDTIGGVWTFTRELTSGLLESGCAVMLVSLGRQPSHEQQLWADAMERNSKGCFLFHSTETPLEWMQGNERAYSEAAPLLHKLAEQFNASLLHCNQFCFGALPVSIPKLVTAHSDVLSWANCCRHLPLEESSWLRRYRSLVSSGLIQADAVVAPTRWMLDALSANFSLPQQHQVVANGLTLAPLKEVTRKLRVITAGRLWDEAKNIALFSEVHSPMPLVIAGESSNESTDLNHAESVGVISHESLLQRFSESSVYVCSSKYEPFGLAPLEAALCGCAVVAHDIPSLREVWGEGAIYFHDASALSQTLHALHADPHALAVAQERSMIHALRYSRAAMTSVYIHLFRESILRKEGLAHVA